MSLLKNIKFPTAHTVLFLISAVICLLTWLLPAGQFDRLSFDHDRSVFMRSSSNETIELPVAQQTLTDLGIAIPIDKFTSGALSKPISIPGTYKRLDQRPQGIIAFIQAPLRGIIQSADIILLVLIIGGLVQIVNATKAFEAGISWLGKRLQGKEYVLIIMVTTLIALGGTTFGLEEETIAFYPILLPIFLAANYDALVCVGAIYIGSCIGTLASTINPFSTIIASDAAGINWTEGLQGRIFMLVFGLIICITYIIRYAQRIKRDPKKSIIYAQKESIENKFVQVKSTTAIALNGKLKLVLFLFASCFLIMVYGVSQLGWWFLEMTSIFLAGALLIGLVARMKEKVFVNEFIIGAKDLLSVAFIIGIARGVTILMNDGQISDTLLFYTSEFTSGMQKGLFINISYFLYSGLTFFIPSSSGMAVLTMPIMAPLADSAGIDRSLIVSAYQFGCGLFKFINPTGIILASLAIVDVGFDKWLKFVWPLVAGIALLGMIILTIFVYI